MGNLKSAFGREWLIGLGCQVFEAVVALYIPLDGPLFGAEWWGKQNLKSDIESILMTGQLTSQISDLVVFIAFSRKQEISRNFEFEENGQFEVILWL